MLMHEVFPEPPLWAGADGLPCMSFFLTTRQIREQSKDVTRRMGWKNLRAGQRFRAVLKAQGLKRGERVTVLAILECVSNRAERLDAITADDVRREGFPELTPGDFVRMFCKHMKVLPCTTVNRIEFKYV